MNLTISRMRGPRLRFPQEKDCDGLSGVTLANPPCIVRYTCSRLERIDLPGASKNKSGEAFA